ILLRELQACQFEGVVAANEPGAAQPPALTELASNAMLSKYAHLDADSGSSFQKHGQLVAFVEIQGNRFACPVRQELNASSLSPQSLRSYPSTTTQRRFSYSMSAICGAFLTRSAESCAPTKRGVQNFELIQRRREGLKMIVLEKGDFCNRTSAFQARSDANCLKTSIVCNRFA